MSDLNPHLHSLMLLAPVATHVRVCLCICLWEGDQVHMCEPTWVYPHLDPSLPHDQGLEDRHPGQQLGGREKVRG